MKTLRNVTRGAGTVAELLQFLRERKLWWLIPFVAVLVLTAMLLIIGQVTGVAPFIYTLF